MPRKFNFWQLLRRQVQYVVLITFSSNRIMTSIHSAIVLYIEQALHREAYASLALSTCSLAAVEGLEVGRTVKAHMCMHGGRIGQSAHHKCANQSRFAVMRSNNKRWLKISSGIRMCGHHGMFVRSPFAKHSIKPISRDCGSNRQDPHTRATLLKLGFVPEV